MKTAKPLTATEQRELDALVAKIEVAYRRRRQADRIGLRCLREIHQRRLYRAFGTFAEFVREKFQGRSRQWAYDKMMQVETLANLEGIGIKYLSQAKAKLLRAFPPEAQREIARRDPGDQPRDAHPVDLRGDLGE